MAALREEMAKGRCDWCKGDATDLRDRRDYDEGMCGPVYSVCGACAKRHQDRINAELDSYYDAADFADDYDDDEPDDYDPGSECGRWENGKLSGSCVLAGTEFCDFECPHRR